MSDALRLPRIQRRRHFKSMVANGIIMVFAGMAILPLILVFSYITSSGLPSLNLDFFVKLPAPAGETGGGMANAIAGSVLMVVMSGVMAIPPGLLCGLYIAEFPRQKLAGALRFVIDLMTGVPSIVIGLFAYATLVVPLGGFNAFAGSAALAIIMLPVVSRTTEEILRLIPAQLREAGLALGLPRWKVLLRLIMRAGRSAIATGVFLAIARASGETAPLLFTSFNNQYWTSSLSDPVASLPVQIYTYAISPYEEWHRLAWAGSLVLVSVVFAINLMSRVLLKRSSN
ncbi:MAG: phosphate ABC transporter permease PstA [Proteobacteria bacterium]|nr:phosphate ABC transporter permease PstA [Pseudomonadota bacterium]